MKASSVSDDGFLPAGASSRSAGAVAVSVEGKLLRISMPRIFDRADWERAVAAAKSLPGRRWDPQSKRWTAPATPAVAAALEAAFRPLEEEGVVGGVSWGPGCAGLLEDARRAAAALDRKRADLDAPAPPGEVTASWRHQRRAHEFAADLRACMLNMGMGTGKSKVAIDLMRRWKCRRVLIVCPLSVVPVWPRQLAAHAAPGEFDALAPGGRAGVEEKARAVLDHVAHQRNGKPRVVVLNYEAVRYRRVEGEPGPLESALRSVDWDLVVLDESHRIKDPGGSTSLICAGLRDRAARRLCLTGTPLHNSPLDAYAQYRFLDPGILGSSYKKFKERYACLDRFGGVDRSAGDRGYKNLDELGALMDRATFTALASEVLDLPPFTDVERCVTLSKSEQDVYDQLSEEFCADVETGEVTPANALVRLLRLQQVTSGHVNDESGNLNVLGRSKEAALVELLEDLGPGEPAVVFCRFVADLDAVHRAAAEVGRRSIELSGRRKDVQGVWEGRADVLAAQVQAGGLGVDLTRARYCAYFSLGFSLGDYEQTRARVHRPGQSRPVTYVHLVAPGTVDEAVYGALRSKRHVVDAVMESMAGGGGARSES